MPTLLKRGGYKFKVTVSLLAIPDYHLIMNPLSNENLHTSHRRGGVLDIKLFVWNVRGVGNRHFLNELKEHLRLHKPHILAVLETHISGDRADEICRRSGFDKWYRVEAQGFQGDIWFL